MRRGVAVSSVLIGAVAVAGTTWGVASQVLRSPAEIAAAASAPVPSVVTAPVREQELVAELRVRGTMRFEDPVVLRLRGAPAADGEPVVTAVPDEGDEIASGDVLLEVSGRPVFLLEGRLPSYRDLRPGAGGGDVEQLQEALAALGHGDVQVTGTFDDATQGAVRALYEAAGYEPPGPSIDEEERLVAAEDRVRGARHQVQDAERVLTQAGQGPSRAEVLQAESSVNEAKDLIGQAEDATSRRRAEEQLAIAQAHLDDLRAAPDTTAEKRAFELAREELAAAESAVADLRASIGTWLPAGEVVHLAGLPQRIDTVSVRLGDPAMGDLVTMTTPEIVVEATVRATDIDLVAVGDEVWIEQDGGGDDILGTIIEIDESPDGDGVDGRYGVLIEPDLESSDLVGLSLLVRIPVSSTHGAVLTVPIAALSARGDGSSIVEVVDDATGQSRLVTVEPGLTTDGLVEVTPIDGELRDGDQVVVTGSDVDTGPSTGGGNAGDEESEVEDAGDADGGAPEGGQEADGGSDES